MTYNEIIYCELLYTTGYWSCVMNVNYSDADILNEAGRFPEYDLNQPLYVLIDDEHPVLRNHPDKVAVYMSQKHWN